ncbi:ATP-binding protein [Aeromonas allosaccharophila]|uniref:AlbA family DNA-binding domain-containing protein n=1 Tax=Aeromonas allosaccharophila TaxID=656 RepID=UPI003003F61D
MKNVSEIIQSKAGDELVYLDCNITPERLSRYVCAMANTMGGFILIGFKDQTMVVGVDIPVAKAVIMTAKSQLSVFSSSTPIFMDDIQNFRGFPVIVIQVYRSNLIVLANQLPYVMVDGFNRLMNQDEMMAIENASHMSQKDILTEVKDLVEDSSRKVSGLAVKIRESQSIKSTLKNNLIGFLCGLVLTYAVSVFLDMFKMV